MDNFTYLGAIISKQGMEKGADIDSRKHKWMGSFTKLK